MRDCENIAGHMAMALYEPLAPEDQQALDAHLAVCGDCRAEFGELRSFVDELPLGEVDFGGDLRPAIRDAIRLEGHQRGLRWWPWVASLAACFLFVGIGLALFNAKPSEHVAPTVTAMSAVDQTIASVHRQLDAGESVAARESLIAALEGPITTDEVGRLRLELASIEYDVFHRYELADREYSRVREEHGALWAASDGSVKERYELLEDAREFNYEPLQTIDAVRKRGTSDLGDLEAIMARYPGRTLAGEAMSTMVALVDGDGVEGLERVKAQCTNPVAVAQLDVHLGEALWQLPQRHDEGRDLLNAVADGPHEVPAVMAQNTLARLESNPLH